MNRNLYTIFHINIIVLIVSSVMFIPIVSVIAFIFDLQDFIDPLYIILAGASCLVIFVGASVILLVFQRSRYYRRVKPSYHKEFSLIVFICALGVLGSGIIFTYFGGPSKYIAHVIIPIFLAVFSVVIFIGRRYLNVNLFRR